MGQRTGELSPWRRRRALLVNDEALPARLDHHEARIARQLQRKRVRRGAGLGSSSAAELDLALLPVVVVVFSVMAHPITNHSQGARVRSVTNPQPQGVRLWVRRRQRSETPANAGHSLVGHRLSLSPPQPSKPRPSFSLQARLAADACVRLGSGAGEPLFA
jgi:hypothetical protein